MMDPVEGEQEWNNTEKALGIMPGVTFFNTGHLFLFFFFFSPKRSRSPLFRPMCHLWIHFQPVRAADNIHCLSQLSQIVSPPPQVSPRAYLFMTLCWVLAKQAPRGPQETHSTQRKRMTNPEALSRCPKQMRKLNMPRKYNQKNCFLTFSLTTTYPPHTPLCRMIYCIS